MATLIELCAAAAIHARLELIVGMNVLPEALEQDTRLLIARHGRAFGIDSIAERSNVIPLEEATLELVRREMNRG